RRRRDDLRWGRSRVLPCRHFALRLTGGFFRVEGVLGFRGIIFDLSSRRDIPNRNLGSIGGLVYLAVATPYFAVQSIEFDLRIVGHDFFESQRRRRVTLRVGLGCFRSLLVVLVAEVSQLPVGAEGDRDARLVLVGALELE